MDGDWERDGIVVVPGCLSPAEVPKARSHVGERTGLVAGSVAADPTWAALARAPGLVAAATLVLGDGVQIFSACYVVKPARSPAFARWHQDGGSWPLSRPGAATVWAALDDVDAASGGMVVAPGSHRAGPLPHTPDADSIFGTGLDAPAGAVRSVDLRAGDASVHHPFLLHGSGPNATDRRRAALVVRYVAADVTITADGWPPLLPT
jgi:ectoine hydroxylase-related dioxygenase (phytanoyl-CoA dioxygenase family)